MPPVMEPPPVEEQSGELFRALQDAGADIETAYRADREVRSQAGQNVIAAIKADNAETRAEMNARFREMDAHFLEMRAENDARFREMRAENDARFREMRAENDARFREMKAENDARFAQMKAENDVRFREVMAEIRVVNGRIDMLRQVMWRVVWPLVVLVFSIVMGVFYRFLFDV